MKTATLELRIRRLAQRYPLARIELTTIDGRMFHAAAYPQPWSKVVGERQAKAFADAGPVSLSIAEATQINDAATRGVWCQASGATALEAIEALAAALGRGEGG